MSQALGEAFIDILADMDPFGEGLGQGIEDALGDVEGSVAASLDGVSDTAAAAFDGVGDAAAAGFDGIGDAADSAAGEVGEAFDGVGDTIASEVAAGVDEAEASLGGFTDSLGSVQGALGTLAGGAGLEGFARSQQDATLSVTRGAERMGESEDAVRSMIDGITDWTFSSADAAAGMELLNQRGIDNIDTVEALLPAWDNFADATGQDFVKAMDDGQRALGAFGIPAEDAAEHMDTLTFLTNEIDVPLDRLSRQVRGNEEDLAAMGIGLDESAGLLGALQAKGMDGRDAVALFGRAVKGSEGDLDDLLGELGLTAEEFETYTGKVAEAEGITERQANQANDLATPMERLGGFVENLGFRFGGLGQAAGMVAAPLGAMGPIMLGINQAGGAFAKILPALGGALRGVATAFRVLSTAILTNPIFLIAALVIGIIAVIWHFREEIIEALVGAWEWVREKTSEFWDWLTEATSAGVAAVVEWFQGLRDRVTEFFTAMWDFVIQYHPLAIAFRLAVEWVPRIIEWFQNLRDRAIAVVTGWVEGMVEWVTNLWTRYMEWGQAIRDGIVDWIQNMAATVIARVGLWVSEVIEFAMRLRDGVLDIINWMVERVIRGAERIWEGWVRIFGWLRDNIVDRVREMVDTVVGFVTDLRDRWIDIANRIRDAVVDSVVNLARRVVSTVTQWVLDVMGFVRNLRDDFGGTIRELVDNAVGFVRELPGRILDVLRNARTLLLDIGKDLIRGLIDGISSMASSAVESVGEVARDMVGAVTGIFRRQSPSRVFMDIGEDVIRGLQLGVENLAPGAIDEIERFANEATSAGQMGALFTEPTLRPAGPDTAAAIRPTDIGGGERAGSSVTWHVEQTITPADPQQAADESVRRLRELTVLGGPFDPPGPEVTRG